MLGGLNASGLQPSGSSTMQVLSSLCHFSIFQMPFNFSKAALISSWERRFTGTKSFWHWSLFIIPFLNNFNFVSFKQSHKPLWCLSMSKSNFYFLFLKHYPSRQLGLLDKTRAKIPFFFNSLARQVKKPSKSSFAYFCQAKKVDDVTWSWCGDVYIDSSMISFSFS